MYRFFPGDTANFDHDRSQRRRKKNTDHIFKLLVMICIKFTQDPGIKLFCIKRRLQIQESSKGSFSNFLPIWALAERISGPVTPK